MNSVLILDDSDAFREILRKILEEKRYAVVEAESVKDARDAIAWQYMPNLVILADRSLGGPVRDEGWLWAIGMAKLGYAVILMTGVEPSRVDTFGHPYVLDKNEITVRLLDETIQACLNRS